MPKKKIAKPKIRFEMTPEVQRYFREVGRTGGNTRNDNLTPKERKKIARKAATARWEQTIVEYKGFIIALRARSLPDNTFTAKGYVRTSVSRVTGLPFETTIEAPGRHSSKQSALDAGVSFAKELIDK